MSEESRTGASPAISIIVPVYNVEKWLPACLESIASQTFRDFECIVVDDGSPDGCGAICDGMALRDARFRVIHQANAGVSSARNAGIDSARGEWLMFVDADDAIEPTMCEELLDAAVQNGADLVQCGHADVYSGGRSVFYPPEHPELNNFDGFVFCKLIKRSLFTENNIRFPDGIKLVEDRFMSAQALYFAKKIFTLKKPLYLYNKQNDTSVTTIGDTTDRGGEGDLSAWNKVFAIFEKDPSVSPRALNSFKLEAKLHLITHPKFRDVKRWRKTFPEANKWVLRSYIGFPDKVWCVLALLHLEGIAYTIQRIHHAGKIKR